MSNVLALIDRALDDHALSEDAMRWTADDSAFASLPAPRFDPWLDALTEYDREQVMAYLTANHIDPHVTPMGAHARYDESFGEWVIDQYCLRDGKKYVVMPSGDDVARCRIRRVAHTMPDPQTRTAMAVLGWQLPEEVR